MKVSLIQMDIKWGGVEENLSCLDSLLDSVEPADLYVFPEMFTTGFATPDDAVTESGDPCRGLEWMREKARAKKAAMAGSIALQTDAADGEGKGLESHGGKCVNRFFFVTPDGETTIYDKRHLFEYGGEGRRFRCGSERVVVEYSGIRFLLAVCYDLRFPVWLRNRGDYDAMILVASWPDKRRYAWDTLVRARAIENQCYVLAVNRIGTDPECSYSGGTVLLNPYGEEIAKVEDDAVGLASGDMDMDMLAGYRAKFPVLSGADAFTLGQ